MGGQDPRAGTREVALFIRQPRPLDFSIENFFRLVADRLPDRFRAVWTESPYPNVGVLPRIRTVLWARRHQRSVNHVVGDGYFVALLLSRRRTVLTIHDCEFMERAGAGKRLLYRWFWLVLPVARAAVVTVPTQDAADDLRRYVRIDPARLRVVPAPVDPRFREDRRASLQDRPLILQMGTRSNKNLERVIEALAGTECRLRVVGRLSERQRELLRTRAIEFEALEDLDTERVAACYREADVVVFASTKEGFGLPIVEAQATGRPLVTSDRPPMTEVAGGGAVFVDPSDVDSIRDGIRRVLDDPELRERIVAEGLANVRRFDADTVAAAYAALYDEIASSLR